MYNDIPTYFEYLIDKSNSRKAYITYLIVQNLNILVRDSFLWLLLIYNDNKNEVSINRMIELAFYIFVAAIILKYIAANLQTQLIVKIDTAHIENCVGLLKTLNRKQLLDWDLTKFSLRLKAISEAFIIYLDRKFFITKILSKFVTVYLSMKSISVGAIIVLLIIFNYMIFIIQKNMIPEEFELLESSNSLSNRVREQIVEAKQKLVNGTFNSDHLRSVYNDFTNQFTRISEIRNNLHFYSDLVVISITGILVFKLFNNIPVFEKILYLLVVDDLNGIFESVIELYRTKPILKLANNFVAEHSNMKKQTFEPKVKGKIRSLKFNSLTMDSPALEMKRPLKLKIGDCLILNGQSGSGKSSLLKAMKGIYPAMMDYKLKLDTGVETQGLSNLCYFSLQSQKPIYAKYLYDYVSNHKSNTNEKLIRDCLYTAQIGERFDGNCRIKLSQFSGGELIRLSIAQMLYEIISGDYPVVMLDEMDANLDTKTATAIFTNIKRLLSDRILLVIVHNEDLKDLFEHKINIVDGVVY